MPTSYTPSLLPPHQVGVLADLPEDERTHLQIEALKQFGRLSEAREAWRALSQRPDLSPAERGYVEKLGRSLTGSGR